MHLYNISISAKVYVFEVCVQNLARVVLIRLNNVFQLKVLLCSMLKLLELMGLHQLSLYFQAQ